MQAALSTTDFDKAISRLPMMVNAARLAILVSLLTIFFMFRQSNTGVVHLSFVPFVIWSVIYGMGIILSLFYPRWKPQQKNLPAFTTCSTSP
jgi:two-component system sensor histidine kinase PilS (NtrC family)